MSTHASEEEELLTAALSTAFTPAPFNVRDSPGIEPARHHASTSSANPASAVPQDGATSEEESEQWKSEYDAQVLEWRSESAAQRRKAEDERARWEEIRAKEAASLANSSASLKNTGSSSVWESIGTEENATSRSSPSPADVRDLVSGEQQKSEGATQPSPQASQDGASRTWEDVPSLASSYPSLAFPDTPPSDSRGKEKATSDPSQPTIAPPSATLTVFDAKLPKGTRALALFSSLAINLFLPFINGMMLGFGEIFARNVMGRWGWKVNTSPATAIGVGAVSQDPEARRQR